MKTTGFAYSIAILALLAILAAFIAYTTDRLPPHAPKQHAPVETVVPTKTSAPAVKEKSCECCAERRERIRKRIQDARERRQKDKQDVSTDTR